MIHSTDRPAIISNGRRISFHEMLCRISLFAEQCPTQPQDRVLVLSENREGWIYSLYATWVHQSIVVPVDAASTPHDVAYIIDDCEPSAIWVSRKKYDLLQASLQEAEKQDVASRMKVCLMDDYETAPLASLPEAVVENRTTDTALICYTSGTTGSPKGVMLSFDNLVANINAVSREVPIFNPERRTLILLPLHHVLPLVGTILMPMYVGGGVAICPSLGAPDIMRTLVEGRIGIMIGVPRLWQTLYRGIKGKIDASPITRFLFWVCEKAQNRSLSRTIFSSVRKKMGGAITYCVSGGAALDADTASGLKTLGLDVLEGYGMTEASPMISFTRPDDIRPGCVGLPLPSVELKLVDGELCARGKNIMQGYYNRPEETADIIDADGFLHTGDLATIDEAGRVTITGRKKEIIVLSNGKNVNPSEIEFLIERYDSIVKEAAVTQDGDLLKVIVVPQKEWAEGKTEAEMEEAIKREVLQPYNQSVAPYKKLMSLFVYQGELPRTRLEKLQRFKLKDIIAGKRQDEVQPDLVEPTFEEYRIIKQYIQQEKRCQVKPTDNLETDLAFDSLDKVALQGFFEQTFGIKLTADQLALMGSVKEIAEFAYDFKTHIQIDSIDWAKMLQAPATDLRLPRMAFTGWLFTKCCMGLFRLYFRLSVRGRENIPAKGPFILAPNHQSYLDGPLVTGTLSYKVLRHSYFYAKEDHVRTPLARFLARNHNVIVMKMSTLKDSIRQLGQVLRQGDNIIIFPEGTRTHTGKIADYKKAFAILAQELGVPVVPVVIRGAFEAMPRGSAFPRPHRIEVEYLPAVAPSTPAEETYDDFAKRIRKLAESKL